MTAMPNDARLDEIANHADHHDFAAEIIEHGTWHPADAPDTGHDPNAFRPREQPS